MYILLFFLCVCFFLLRDDLVWEVITLSSELALFFIYLFLNNSFSELIFVNLYEKKSNYHLKNLMNIVYINPFFYFIINSCDGSYESWDILGCYKNNIYFESFINVKTICLYEYEIFFYLYRYLLYSSAL